MKIPADLEDELLHELTIVRENAARYRGIRTDGLAAHVRKEVRRPRHQTRAEQRQRRELRARERFCEPCGQLWTEWPDGRTCPQCQRIGSVA